MNRRLFKRKFDASVVTEGGCRLWSGCLFPQGYGKCSSVPAHRVAFEFFISEIPAGMTVDHLCFEPRCVEPKHLRLLSNLANCRNHRDRPVVVPDGECINGHRYSPANTYVRPNGQRDCRTCIRERVRKYVLRKKGLAA